MIYDLVKQVKETGVGADGTVVCSMDELVALVNYVEEEMYKKVALQVMPKEDLSQLMKITKTSMKTTTMTMMTMMTMKMKMTTMKMITMTTAKNTKLSQMKNQL